MTVGTSVRWLAARTSIVPVLVRIEPGAAAPAHFIELRQVGDTRHGLAPSEQIDALAASPGVVSVGLIPPELLERWRR